MPKINIYETENISIGQLSATESNVLVPLFVKDASSLTVEKYTDYITFTNAITVDNVTVIGDEVDFSYYMACELIGKGLPVYIKPIETTEDMGAISDSESDGLYFETESAAETALSTLITNGLFEEFKDKNLYNVKFITTGAHANALVVATESSESTTYSMTGCYDTLASIAQARTDAIALIELQSDTDIDSDDTDNSSIMNRAAMLNLDDKHLYSAIFYPWGVYNCSYAPVADQSGQCVFPACFGYLAAFANSIITNDDWLAASGVSRGYIPNLDSLYANVGDSLMHILQGDDSTTTLNCFINPIMYKGSYGIRVWGNKVARRNTSIANTSYTTYLNVRLLLCDIKKQMYAAATRVTFEPNDDITWLNFKNLNNTLLDRMQSGRGIDWYSWVKEVTTAKATIQATLYIKPIEAVEYFELTVYLTDQDASVTETV